MNTFAPVETDRPVLPVVLLVVAVFAFTLAMVAAMTAPRTAEITTVEVTTSDGQQVTAHYVVG